MPRKCPDELRRRAIALVRAGQSVTKTASDLGPRPSVIAHIRITDTCFYGWLRQDRIDRGEMPGTNSAESHELRTARRRIRELEAEVEILRRANAMPRHRGAPPKRIDPVIHTLTDTGFSVTRCCSVRGGSPHGCYAYRRRPPSPTKMRRDWLTALITELHADSRGTYGARRVRAELTKREAST